jgi:Protein of unknown function (DUF3606)
MNPCSTQRDHSVQGAFMARRSMPITVDLANDSDLRFWTLHLRCSAEQLLAALESVGPRVEHVTEYLRAGW